MKKEQVEEIYSIFSPLDAAKSPTQDLEWQALLN